MSMIKDAINKILELAPTERFEIDEREYTSALIHPVKLPDIARMNINTLTGIVDYIKSDIDCFETKTGSNQPYFVHVESFREVSLCSPLEGDFDQRFTYIEASAEPSSFNFNNWYQTDNFIIQLQSHFEDTEDRQKILSLVGNLKDEHVKTVDDNGISQTVTAKQGISLSTEALVPNPVTLKPFRTFLEVDQPESQFVFRMESGRQGQLPTCALFSADGGQWKLKAIQTIKKWLKKELPETVTIIA